MLKIKKKIAVTLLLFAASIQITDAQNYKLRNFFSERYVQNYFSYAHPNVSSFNGIDIVSIADRRVTLQASFKPIFSSTFVCTINVFLDDYGRFVNVVTRCDSPSRMISSCFDVATDDLKRKCSNSSNGNQAINFMEQYYGKTFRQFNGNETICTLLNIAWFNYDY